MWRGRIRANAAEEGPWSTLGRWRVEGGGADEVTSLVIGAAIAVHRELGPGLLESVYRVCLAHELRLRGLEVEQECLVPVQYKGHKFDNGFRLDLVVRQQVIVELKCVRNLDEVHTAQLLTCLRLTRIEVGLLLNFNVARLQYGIRRVVLAAPPARF
jgi:GxxExxY protein